MVSEPIWSWLKLCFSFISKQIFEEAPTTWIFKFSQLSVWLTKRMEENKLSVGDSSVSS